MRNLKELDVSRNGFRPPQMAELLETLSENRRLEIVDLSWNSIVDDEPNGPS
jgi:Ran GTPase-activating protein (RanGAP) involved in mRNA processing and transport